MYVHCITSEIDCQGVFAVRPPVACVLAAGPRASPRSACRRAPGGLVPRGPPLPPPLGRAPLPGSLARCRSPRRVRSVRSWGAGLLGRRRPAGRRLLARPAAGLARLGRAGTGTPRRRAARYASAASRPRLCGGCAAVTASASGLGGLAERTRPAASHNDRQRTRPAKWRQASGALGMPRVTSSAVNQCARGMDPARARAGAACNSP